MLTSYQIDYAHLQRRLDQLENSKQKRQFIFEHLLSIWQKQYEELAARPVSLICIPYNGFHYYYDDYGYLVVHKIVQPNEKIEDRVIGVIGCSNPTPRSPRTASWLKGLIGPTEMRWGPHFDKGHFVAHTLGGGTQLNIFPQRRDLNRGRSEAGKRYRQMERYCYLHPGTLLFHRPIYFEEGFQPSLLEFGFVSEDAKLKVECFDNSEILLAGKRFENKIPMRGISR